MMGPAGGGWGSICPVLRISETMDRRCPGERKIFTQNFSSSSKQVNEATIQRRFILKPGNRTRRAGLTVPAAHAPGATAFRVGGGGSQAAPETHRQAPLLVNRERGLDRKGPEFPRLQ